MFGATSLTGACTLCAASLLAAGVFMNASSSASRSVAVLGSLRPSLAPLPDVDLPTPPRPPLRPPSPLTLRMLLFLGEAAAPRSAAGPLGAFAGRCAWSLRDGTTKLCECTSSAIADSIVTHPPIRPRRSILLRRSPPAPLPAPAGPLPVPLITSNEISIGWPFALAPLNSSRALSASLTSS